MFDSNPSSSSHPRSDLAAVSAMAEAQPTSGVATGVQPGHGSVPNPWQGDIDALKQEVNDLRTTVLSLTKEIEELKRVKVQTVCGVLCHSPSILIGVTIPIFASVYREHR